MGIMHELKLLVAFARKAKDPDLMDQVIALQTHILELQDRLRYLEKENEKLRDSQKIKESLVIRDGVYFIATEQGEDGPYCTRCWDVAKNLVRLKFANIYDPTCPECRNSFYHHRLS